MLEINLNGQNVANYDRLYISTSLNEVSNDFTLEVALSENNNANLKVGNPINIKVNNLAVFNGFIESWKSIQSKNNSTFISNVAVTGREWNSLFLDSNLPPVDMSSVKTLSQMITLIASKLSSKIKYVSLGVDVSLSDKIITTDITQNCFLFCKRYADRGGVMIIGDDSSGGLSLYSNKTPKTNSTAIYNGKNTKTELDFDITGRYNIYNGIDQTQSVSDVATATDSGATNGKTLTIYSPLTTNASELSTFTKWVANIKKSESLKYSVTLAYSNNANFKCGEQVQVADSFNGIDGYMLIYGIDYLFTKEGNSITLFLTYPDAYSTSLSDSLKVSYAN